MISVEYLENMLTGRQDSMVLYTWAGLLLLARLFVVLWRRWLYTSAEKTIDPPPSVIGGALKAEMSDKQGARRVETPEDRKTLAQDIKAMTVRDKKIANMDPAAVSTQGSLAEMVY